MNYLDFLVKISVCFILGGLIGFERQWRRKTIGIRTITLVALGSFLFVSISNLTNAGDVTRIAAQVVSGIGFLGAGVILREGTHIRGLNTAATLWCSAAVGSLTALGLIFEASVGVFYILFSNIFLRFISRKLLRKTLNTKIINYVLTIRADIEKEDSIKNILIQQLKSHQITTKSYSMKKENDEVVFEVKIGIESNYSKDIGIIISKLCAEPGIKSVVHDEALDYVEEQAYDDDDDSNF